LNPLPFGKATRGQKKNECQGIHLNLSDFAKIKQAYFCQIFKI